MNDLTTYIYSSMFKNVRWKINTLKSTANRYICVPKVNKITNNLDDVFNDKFDDDNDDDHVYDFYRSFQST